MNELAIPYKYRIYFKDLTYADVDMKYGDTVLEAWKDKQYSYPLSRLGGKAIKTIADIKEMIDLDKDREEKRLKKEAQDKRFEFINKFTGSNEYDHNAVEVLRFQAKCGGRFDDMIYKANDEMKVKIKKYLEDTIDSMKKAPYADQHNQEYATIKDNEIIKDYKYFLTLLEP